MTYEDPRERFSTWYADNTDADYDDVCAYVNKLLNLHHTKIYEQGFEDGVSFSNPFGERDI